MAGCGDDSKKGCDGYGRLVVGYWGRDVHRQLFADQQAAKERGLLAEQVNTGGIRAAMWYYVSEGEKCTCYKESYRQADRKCSSCHGTGFVPGYLKFGYQTEWMASADDDLVFTNTRITREIKTAKIELLPGQTTGTVESGDKAFVRSAVGSEWEYDVQSFVRTPGFSDVAVEFSLDSGGSWADIATLPTVNPSSGVIRFRATLTRDDADVLSPLFEIVRARYATIDLQDSFQGVYRRGPWILVMRSVPVRRFGKSEYGDMPFQEMNMWTTGLSAFDPSIEVGSREELVEGPNVLMEILDGVLAGSRYITTSWQNSDPFAEIVTTQTFQARIEDPVGPYSLVW